MEATAVALLESLEQQRSHVTGILDGLDETALIQPVLPTGWSCVGLVQHLALDVERFWFRVVMAGELPHPAPDAADGWQVDASVTPRDVLDGYLREIEHANRIISSTALEQPPAAWPDEQFGEFRLPDLRAMMLHVITETACHAGHLDAARELLDGQTWLIL